MANSNDAEKRLELTEEEQQMLQGLFHRMVREKAGLYDNAYVSWKEDLDVFQDTEIEEFFDGISIILNEAIDSAYNHIINTSTISVNEEQYKAILKERKDKAEAV